MFKFATNVINIEIEDSVFPVAVDKALKDKLDTCAKWSEQLKNDTAVTEEKAIELYTESIDLVLGAGASKRIFAGRDINLFDCMDVFVYISSEIESFSKARANKYASYIKG